MKYIAWNQQTSPIEALKGMETNKINAHEKWLENPFPTISTAYKLPGQTIMCHLFLWRDGLSKEQKSTNKVWVGELCMYFKLQSLEHTHHCSHVRAVLYLTQNSTLELWAQGGGHPV